MDVWAASLAGDTKALIAALSADPKQSNALKKGGLFDGRTPLHCAASRGHGDAVSALLARGADMKLIDKRGCTAAQLASKQGFEQIALAIERSDGSHKQDVASSAPSGAEEVTHAEVIAASSCGQGATQAAEQPRQQRATKRARELPVDLGTEISASQPLAKRANIVTDAARLCRYAVNGNADELFSCLSADPSLIDIAQVGGLFDGRNPLHCAAARGHADIVAGLLQLCADPSIADKRGCTALMLAQKQGHAAIAVMLERHALQSKSTFREASARPEFDVSDAMLGIENVEACNPDRVTSGSEVRTEVLPVACCASNLPKSQGGQSVTELERRESCAQGGTPTPEPASPTSAPTSALASASASAPAPSAAAAPASAPASAATPAPERVPEERAEPATATRAKDEDEDSIINRILEEDQSADEEFLE
eukprot:6184720-Pleurochrysis_carterae.AAC.4